MVSFEKSPALALSFGNSAVITLRVSIFCVLGIFPDTPDSTSNALNWLVILGKLEALHPRIVCPDHDEHGYKVAEVTLSFGDYAYNEPYARCVAKNDQAGIEQLKQGYLSGAAESLAQGEKMSKLIYGRDIKHVMLLHIGAFETVMLPHLLDLLKQRGFKLITLQEAESDPAYANDPTLPSNWGGTFLQQMMVAEHIPLLVESEDRLAKIDALCR